MHFFGITSLSQLEYENPWPLNPLQKKKKNWDLKNRWIIYVVFVPDKIIMFRKGKKITFTNKIGTDLE